MAPSSKKPFLPQVLTANLLEGGEVVYRAEGACWTSDLAGAEVYKTPQACVEAEANAAEDVAARIIIDPYLFAVEDDQGSPVPQSVREVIRSKGPTVRRDLGKQAEDHAPSTRAA